MKVWTIEEKRNLLDSCNGRFFSVKFVKKDGEIREANCKKWIESKLSSGNRNDVGVNTCAGHKHLYTANDVNKPEGRGWININLNNLLEATVNGVKYIFE